MARRTAPPVAEPLFETPARQPNILSDIPTHLIDEMPGHNPRTDYGDHDGTFARLWDSINGKRPGCSWGDNPWVWVLEFRRVEGEVS